MNKKVKLKHKVTGQLKELEFFHAERFLNIDKSFECANDDYQFIGNELIKRPSIKGSKKPRKSKPNNEGEAIPE